MKRMDKIELDQMRQYLKKGEARRKDEEKKEEMR